jgi:DNA-binding CsgD family transcriptional regulator
MGKIIFSIICIAVFCYYIYTGLYVLSLNRKHKTHITFFILAMLLAFLTLGCVLFQLFETVESVLSLYILGTSLTIFFPILVSIISLQLSNIIRLKWIHYAAIFTPGIFIAVKTMLVNPSVTFMYHDNSWRLVSIDNPAHFYLYFIIFIVYALIYVAINLIWYFRTLIKREKKQAIVLLLSAFISIFTYSVIMVLLVHVFKVIKYEYVGSSCLSFFIWAAGFGYCLVHYRLLSFTPDMVSKDIISAIEESIILMDVHGNIITANDKTKTLLGHKDMNNFSLKNFILQHDQISILTERLLANEVQNFSCRLIFLNIKREEIFMDAKFSLVKDKFEEPAGILIIARETREFKHLKAIYKITDREAHIIQFIIDGHLNREIAESLGITENTLKRHITNIYNKLTINNKIGLINLLKEFDLVPERKAERVVLALTSKIISDNYSA